MYSRRWLILAVVGVAQLMVVLDATVVSIALPSAQRAQARSSAPAARDLLLAIAIAGRAPARTTNQRLLMIEPIRSPRGSLGVRAGRRPLQE
jgi:hypothetical protein